jgi:hypothetical protein
MFWALGYIIQGLGFRVLISGQGSMGKDQELSVKRTDLSIQGSK